MIDAATSVKQARLECNLTQQELADRVGAGISQAYISMIESGTRTPSEWIMTRLMEAMGYAEVNGRYESFRNFDALGRLCGERDRDDEQ